MIQEKLKKFFNKEPFISTKENITFYADSVDNANKIKDRFELYKKTSDGSFLSNFSSNVNLRKNGYTVDCHGKIYNSSINGEIKYSLKDILFALTAAILVYFIFSYLVK